MLLNQDQSLPNQDQNLEQQLHTYFSQLVSGLRQNNQSPPTNEIIDHSKQVEVGRSESNPELRGTLPRKRKLQYVNRCSQEPQITQLFHSLQQHQTNPAVFQEPSFELLHHDATPSNPISSPYSEEDDSDEDSEEDGNVKDGSTQASKNTRGRTKLLKLFKRTKPVKRKFKIPEGGKRWVILSIGKKWREFKCMLKKLHYDPHITYEERIADRDSRVIPNEWEFLVNYWNSESALDRSAKNKATRAKQDITHTAGTKSFARVRAEMTKETKVVPKRHELYIRTHTKKNGEALESCKSNIVAIKNLSSHNTEIAQKNASRDDLLVMALGEGKRQNYVRCYGLGATPSEVFGSNPTRVECLRMLSETQKIAEEEKHALQKEMVEMRQEMSLMRARLETMKKKSQDVNILEDRDIPSNSIGTSNPINGTNSIPSEGLPSNEIQSSESRFEVPQNKIYRAKVVAKNVHTTLDNGGGLEVYLKSLKKPHKYAAQGSLLSTNPITKIGGVELGSQCWEVQINVPIEPNEPLLRSYGGFQTIGDALGATVAWPFTYVQRK